MSDISHFVPGDADFINAPSYSKEGILTNHNMKEYSFITVSKNQNILGIVGVKLLNKFVAEFYFVPDVVNIKKFNMSLHRRVRDMVTKFFTKSTYRRFQVWVDADSGNRTKWVERLGFEREAKIKGIGPHGQDQFLFSKIVER
jgi:hypothetical protein